jgi:hypothetical protein
MRVFIAYSSEIQDTAEKLYLKLLGLDHKPFFDKISVTPTSNFDSEIRSAIRKSDLFGFFD